MIGANKLELNQATMCAAVAEYLNYRATSAAQVEVASVSQPGTGSFTVWVKPREADKEKN
jgi:hypothetical protein